ncbi:MAG: 3-hydroxyacyl-CoA dehydrogenase family protein [Bdellovibrionota bacterium]
MSNTPLQVGLLGGGVMGNGIAQVCAIAGLQVTLCEATEPLAQKAKESLESGRYGLARAVERGKLAAEKAQAAKKLVRYAWDKRELAPCGFVIEAVPEDKNLKKKLFAEIDSILSPNAILASNTSGFSITELSEAVSRKERFLGMHFFSPVPVMQVLEIIHTPATSKEAIAAAEELAKKMGKTPIRVKDAPGKYGFVANRVYLAMLKEAQAVVAEGVATMEDVDTVMRLGYNWPVGPFGMIRGAKEGWKK